MTKAEIRVSFSPELHIFLPAALRRPDAPVGTDAVSSLGHVVESLGAPLTEVGTLLAGGRPVDHGYVPCDGDLIRVEAVAKPQHVDAPLRFLLDIHLGTLTRRLRLLGVDAAYENPDIGDAALAARSAAQRRVMLSRDRGLLRRREIFAGAFIYSHRPAEQVDDVLARFAPTLAPWTRCTACNGLLRRTDKAAIRGRLPSGAARTYQGFAECEDCGQAYWQGAHYARLNEFVDHAMRRFGPSAAPAAVTSGANTGTPAGPASSTSPETPKPLR